jgi:hypothetical protein
MTFPFVSRARFEDALQQIADLKEANAKLLELALSKSTQGIVLEPEEQTEPQRPHRKLGAELRKEFREAAEGRFKQAQMQKGSKG